MRKVEQKPLSFSTTMRNPARMALFITCIKEFEGQVLTSEIIRKIVKKVIKNKLYKPMYINKDLNLKRIYEDENITFSDLELDQIIDNSPQEHKEAGFEKGWDSRFDTWYKLCKEFGFIYYKMNTSIEISQSGYMLCDAYNEITESSNEKIQNIFLNALMKYQTNNPFRKNANKNVPIPLLLNVLNLLKLDKDENGVGIHCKELPFFTCWHNNNAHELYLYIKKFRKDFGYSSSDEIIYEKALGLLNSTNKTRFKMNQILKEGIDDLIRKLRITGIFSLRGMGKFIDINKFEEDKIKYIIKNYSTYNIYDDEYSFYKYMGNIDSNIVKLKQNELYDISYIRNKALLNFSNKYSFKEINEEILHLSNNTPSKDEFLKLIEQPTRLEFLISVALVKNYPNYIVKPNYCIDDEGNPTFTAKGGIGDIEIYDENNDVLVEVTLMKSRQQATNEIPSITRHLKQKRQKSSKNNVFSLFIAPILHEDTIYMCEFSKFKYFLDIIPYTIKNFIHNLPKTKHINEFLSIYEN